MRRKSGRHLNLFNKAIIVVSKKQFFMSFSRDFLDFGSGVVSVSCFGVRVSVMFRFMFVHYPFSSV